MKITQERLPNAQIALTVQPDEQQVEQAIRKAADFPLQADWGTIPRVVSPFHIQADDDTRRGYLDQARWLGRNF